MTKGTITGVAFGILLSLLTVGVSHRVAHREAGPGAAVTSAPIPSTSVAHADFLYGRVTTADGDLYEGRLRFGGDEEALWGNYFNGRKRQNLWAAHAPSGRLPVERPAVKVLGVEIARARPFDLGRPFMARFGDIARIEARGGDLRVTLKSGTVFRLDRYAADDFADGVRVWDGRRGVVDLGEGEIRSIELLSGRSGAGPSALYGTVHTRQGNFTGFVEWDRKACVGHDVLEGHSAQGQVRLRFDVIRSIARRSRGGALVTLLDGREILLSGTRQDGRGNSGMYVDDPRYGRVLVSWDAFERFDLSSAPGGSGPAYDAFQPGHALNGTVVTRSGRRLTGRLVYDLDESETTETLDAPAQGVDYTIPFGLVSSIAPLGADGAQGARVILHSGEELRLEPAGDLARWNAGMLVFPQGRERAEYVPWNEVERIELELAPDHAETRRRGGAED